jgi:hypothetical protein
VISCYVIVHQPGTPRKLPRGTPQGLLEVIVGLLVAALPQLDGAEAGQRSLPQPADAE